MLIPVHLVRNYSIVITNPTIYNNNSVLIIEIDAMGKSKNASKPLTQEEIWDDSALVQSWDEAVEEYKVPPCRT